MENSMTLEDLEVMFYQAITHGVKYVSVQIQMEGFEKPEVIINPVGNFVKKMEYYRKAYNDDLTLKANTGIKIVNMAYGKSFEDIELSYKEKMIKERY